MSTRQLENDPNIQGASFAHAKLEQCSSTVDISSMDEAVLAPEQQGLKRDLRLRHMVMIAISGTIGTGLFLTSGSTIATAGPAGASIGEIATLLPLPSSYNAWGARIVDEALSFQTTWMSFISGALTLPAELSASAVIASYWIPIDSAFPVWAVPAIIIVIMVCINMAGVKAYGEMEYWFSILKIITIIMFIICGILVDAGVLGHVKYGLTAWHPSMGSPFHGGLLGFVKTLVSVGFAYGGTDNTGMTAAESRNPHKHVPKAVNTVLIRIAFFYITCIFLLASIIPYDDPRLVNASGSAATAPFTIVFAQAGIGAAANFMNAVVLTSIFSAINSGFYITTRMLLSLGRNGWAPQFVGYTNPRGVPVVALAVVTLCACLSLLTVFIGSGTVFSWFVSLLGSLVFQYWVLVLLLHFRFRYCWKKQGRAVSDLPYVSWGYPYGGILGLMIGTGCILATCYLSVSNPPVDPGPAASVEELEIYNSARVSFAQGLLGAWFPWLCSTLLFFSYKWVNKTQLIRAEDADLDTGRFVPTERDLKELQIKRPLWKV
ncbi:hypothetical protein BGZ70_010550 [Mortierella alpina]|uniref:Amino acid permease/ SLC12A domain-containing protein n=1 Tax=Mortierella alpina TaxID=64518 RepID=A0A9P6LZ55_MORAP|nr:hypothetical protein BGZ70_010550 [Mortierella alpina]